jgi:hypothetical protein
MYNIALEKISEIIISKRFIFVFLNGLDMALVKLYTTDGSMKRCASSS